MLNIITKVNAVAVDAACADAARADVTFQLVRPRPRFADSTGLTACLTAAPPTSAYALATARPRTGMTASLAGIHLVPSATGSAVTGSAVTGADAGMPSVSQQFMYPTTTRTSAIGGGALGPHPPREPV